MSPGFAAKMGPMCFTQCIPSTMVKFLSIPLVLLLSAYLSVSPDGTDDEFRHIELSRGYTRKSGKLMAGKTLHHSFSVDAHKGQNFTRKGGLQCVVWLCTWEQQAGAETSV